MPMAAFAPVYRVPVSQRSFLTREQQRAGKRKRDADDSDAHDDGAGSHQNQPIQLEHDPREPRVPHPVNKTDPYHVAGWPREKPLPGGNFPHAAVKDDAAQASLSVEAELARMKPPIYAPKHLLPHSSGSIVRRHLDNLTAILHKSMLNQDWKRASRVWGLMLRTEIDGNGIDIRQHGRWMIGAEILMRRPGGGFKLAREYYDRLILQYPHRHNTPASSFSARVVYPALFNIWIYEVQDRASRAQPDDASWSDLRQIKMKELEEAQPIATRLDELLLSPPYDTMTELLELRANLSLWLSALHKSLAGSDVSNTDETSDEDDSEIHVSSSQHQLHANQELAKAKALLQRMQAAGTQLSENSIAVLEEDDVSKDAHAAAPSEEPE